MSGKSSLNLLGGHRQLPDIRLDDRLPEFARGGGQGGRELRVRVVVADNCSGDDSVPRLQAAVRDQGFGDWVSIKPLERNGGFAYGNNAAIRPGARGK